MLKGKANFIGVVCKLQRVQNPVELESIVQRNSDVLQALADKQTTSQRKGRE